MQAWKQFILGIVFLGYPFYALSEENEQALAHASLNFLKINHFAEHIAAPFENDVNFGYGPENNSQSILNFKPVIPFRLTQAYDLIIRTIAPLYERTATVNQQNRIDGHYINGWGDLNPTFFISPSHFEIFCIGMGPTLFLPTSSNSKNIGSGQWSAGPELAIMAIPGNWMFGFLTYNIWSFAGEKNKPEVNQFSFQYLISYVFDSGWYLSSNPNIVANWKKPSNKQWLVPFGLGIGRAFRFGKQALSVSTHAYYNAIRPAQVGPQWQLQLELEFLFPKATI